MKQSQPDHSVSIQRLGPGDDALYIGMLDVFADAFEDSEAYSSARPGPSYRQALLSRPGFIALVAIADCKVVGALAGYELKKFEQERSEFYIYDLGVTQIWRRSGVATALITEMKTIARRMGGWVVYVQADHGDESAIALYTGLGQREDVLHFDLPLD